MVDQIYGGFVGVINDLVSRFKLKKPPTDIRNEEKKDVEMNVEIHDNLPKNDNRINYKMPNNEINHIN